VIGEMTIGQLLDQSFKIFKDNLKLFLTIGGILYLPAVALQQILPLVIFPDITAAQTQAEKQTAFLSAGIPFMILVGVLTIILILVLTPLLSASITDAVGHVYLERSTTPGRSIRAAFSCLISVLLTQWLGSLFIFLGFLLLVFPGVYLMFAYFVIVPVVVLENEAGWTALKRSNELMKGSKTMAFVLSFLVGIISSGINMIGAAFQVPMISAIILTLGTTVLTVYLTIAVTVLYFHCRSKTENFDLQLLAESVGIDAPVESQGPPPLPSAGQY